MAKKVSRTAALAKIKKIAEGAGFHFNVHNMIRYSDRISINVKPESSTVSMLKNQILSLFKTKSTKLKFSEIANKLGDPKSLTISTIADLIIEKRLARNQTHVWKI